MLFDPFISGNELAQHISLATVQADYILVSHGHYDHMQDVVELARLTGATVIAGWELYQYFSKQGVAHLQPLNPGGELSLPFGIVKAFPAWHSSSLPDGTYAGMAAGFVVKSGEGNFYYSGDTALSKDMSLVADWTAIDFAVLPIGGALTMGYTDAMIAAELVQTTQVVGVHYDTFGFIRIDKGEATASFEAAGIALHLPGIGESITF
ncbi:metal-dependent hydrolase [Filimonas lacunae]|nr:metal-dependent hydrolase [Filimonas lacunae]